MPIKLYKRPTGIFYLRGTVQGERFDRSTHTSVRAEAEQIRAKAESDAFKRAVYGERAVATFAEAALDYMNAGGERQHLTPLLKQIGLKKLTEIDQRLVDKLASDRGEVQPATLVRQIYTPIAAVLNFAAPDHAAKVSFRKPKVRNGRTAYLTPAEAEAWISALPPYLSRLFIFYLATGCRATEAVDLQWREISPAAHRVVFEVTKGGYPRGADIQKRAREALGERGEGYVFLNSRGAPWHGYDAVNLMLRRYRAKPGNDGLVPVHCHLLRHTWATWAHAVTRDLTFVMQQGGWRSLAMLGRYTHASSADLASAVTAHKWEFQGREVGRPKPRGRKS